MAHETGCIYILTNPSFPEYVKIGYASNLEKRLKQLNRSETIPYAFRAYAIYEVEKSLTDKELHKLIDKLNPDLRTIDNFDGKERIKEFFAMSAEDAYASDADEVIGTYKDQYGNCYDSGWRGFMPCEPLVRNLLSIKNSFCVLWGVIFRRELLEGCLDAPREIIEREDSLMQIKCLMKNPKVLFIADPVYLYFVDVPTQRVEKLDWIRLYDNELRKTLQPHWELYKSAFVGHQIKVYEKFIDKQQYSVFNSYYRPLRKQLSADIPLMDRIAIMLPPRVAYYPIHYYKALLKLKQSIARK